ncbi:MAG: TonB-dependent receptor plug domain-containing protein [Elusimicrobia bacterium]|nr:TonB-dependent receptor plug domain-containing protein [Elusimicrobiota bacterium]
MRERIAWSVVFLALGGRAAAGQEVMTVEPVVVLGEAEQAPAARSISRVERRDIETTDSFSLKELLDSTPGVFLKQSNGPRDMSISIRGSGAKTSFAVRNIKMYEDWFPLTQSDGLSRTDLNDPNAYEGIDVFRGPSSAMYDNYALGGAVNFRSRRGRDIDGFDLGTAAGSYGYQNHYAHAGRAYDRFEYAAFASLVRGDGHINHAGYTTVTQDLTAVFTPDESRTITLKFLNNDLKSQHPARLTKMDFNNDSRSAGNTFVTGVGSVPTQRAAQGREDRRTIAGARYEQRFGSGTKVRALGAYDVKDINQTGGTIGDNVNPDFHHYADVTHEADVLGVKGTHYAGAFFNYMEQEANSYRNLADSKGTRGALQSQTRGYHRNYGARLRSELRFSELWTGVLALGVEHSKVKANVQSRAAAESYSRVDVDRSFFNAAPEAGLTFEPWKSLKARARLGMGYGIPGISQLTTTADGLSGNNASLKTQRNLGMEVGASGNVLDMLSYDAALYYEFFYDEFVTQSPGAGLSNFTANAPRSEHRGVELWLEARPGFGLFCNGAWTFNDHVYRSFDEVLGPGDVRDRAGNRIPGVERHVVNFRLGREAKGLPGGWLELNHVASFQVNNSNTLTTEPYALLNANLNYSLELPGSFLKKLSFFFDVRNLLDLTYQASAVTVADAAADTAATLLTGKTAFLAGPGRQFSGGLKAHF